MFTGGQNYDVSARFDRRNRRLFLLNTARYGSFIISAFNRSGYQLEPYGSYSVLDLALRVAPKLWGNHKGLRGNAWIQGGAMAKLNPRMAKIMTYSSFRPMLPFSITTAPLYMLGLTLQVANKLRERFSGIKIGSRRIDLPGGNYLSDSWEIPFLRRTAEKYGMHLPSDLRPKPGQPNH